MKRKKKNPHKSECPCLNASDLTKSLLPWDSAFGKIVTTDVNFQEFIIGFEIHLYSDKKGHLKLQYRGFYQTLDLVEAPPKSKNWNPTWFFRCPLGCDHNTKSLYFTGGPKWGCAKCLKITTTSDKFEILIRNRSRNFEDVQDACREAQTPSQQNIALAMFIEMIERYRDRLKKRSRC